MGMPFANKRHCLTAFLPSTKSLPLVTRITSVEPCKNPTVGGKWFRACYDLDVWQAVTAKKNATRLSAITGVFSYGP
jgi:hypothetical protein